MNESQFIVILEYFVLIFVFSYSKLQLFLNYNQPYPGMPVVIFPSVKYNAHDGMFKFATALALSRPSIRASCIYLFNEKICQTFMIVYISFCEIYFYLNTYLFLDECLVSDLIRHILLVGSDDFLNKHRYAC